MRRSTRISGAVVALAVTIAGTAVFQGSIEDRVTSLESRVATLEAGMAGATPMMPENPAAEPTSAPTETPKATESRPGDIVISGYGGESISESFRLTEGNWFARMEQDRFGGRFIAYAVQIGGGGNRESIFYLYENEPSEAETSFAIYDFTDGEGTYVLEVEAEFSWKITISNRPF